MIKAIQTRYNGYRFRSRLEARWAVFFDAAGIEYQYESEGFKIRCFGKTIFYLPDFFLPKTKTWVEVKGDFRKLNWEVLVHCIEYGGQLPYIEDSLFSSRGLLLLGEIPELDSFRFPCSPLHWMLQHGKGAWVQEYSLAPFHSEYTFADKIFNVGDTEEAERIVNSGQQYSGTSHCSDMCRAAYLAARSARFEHGENPK